MLTYEESLRLLNMAKRVRRKDGSLAGSLEIDLKSRLDMKIDLVAEDDSAYVFQWVIRQSPKDSLKMSLHLMDGDSKEGVFRVDYNASHLNPKECRPELPEVFVPYIGRQFAMDEHHVHYQVEGYRSLAWALPIAETGIDKQEIRTDQASIDMAEAIESFAKFAHIDVKFIILPTLLL